MAKENRKKREDKQAEKKIAATKQQNSNKENLPK